MLSQEQRLFGRVDTRPMDADIRRQVKAALSSQLKGLRQQLNNVASEREAALKRLRAEDKQKRIRFNDDQKRKLLLYAGILIPLMLVGLLLGVTHIVGVWIFSLVGGVFLFGLLVFIVFGLSSSPGNEEMGDTADLRAKVEQVTAEHDEQRNLLEYRLELTQKLLDKINKK